MFIDNEKELEAAPAPDESYVYMLYSGGLIKIGFTTDPVTRFGQLRAMSSAPISLIWLGCGTRAIEGTLHRRFNQSRRRGEWFEPGAALREFLVDRPGMGGMNPIDRLAWAEANPTKAIGP